MKHLKWQRDRSLWEYFIYDEQETNKNVEFQDYFFFFFSGLLSSKKKFSLSSSVFKLSIWSFLIRKILNFFFFFKQHSLYFSDIKESDILDILKPLTFDKVNKNNTSALRLHFQSITFHIWKLSVKWIVSKR